MLHLLHLYRHVILCVYVLAIYISLDTKIISFDSLTDYSSKHAMYIQLVASALHLLHKVMCHDIVHVLHYTVEDNKDCVASACVSSQHTILIILCVHAMQHTCNNTDSNISVPSAVAPYTRL